MAKSAKTVALGFLIGMASTASAAPDPYPMMAPLGRYESASLQDEIALARSAAPPSISGKAEILAFDKHGYRSVMRGSNGFVCLVERSWADALSNREFWNPKIRIPICFNPAATRTVLPFYLRRTKWVLDGRTLSQISALTKVHPAPDPARGALAMMMSKDGYLADGVGAAGPHVMIYLASEPASSWAAGVEDSPVFATPGDKDSITIFYISVRKWSDGTPIYSQQSHH
jgi:hypothetical protein